MSVTADSDEESCLNHVGRKRPNILVTGTPGVGKTSTAARIAEQLHLMHINVGEVIQQHKCYDGYDDELQTHILDEDALLDVRAILLLLYYYYHY
jgi:broad-specificity NMP kinase